MDAALARLGFSAVPVPVPVPGSSRLLAGCAQPHPARWDEELPALAAAGFTRVVSLAGPRIPARFLQAAGLTQAHFEVEDGHPPATREQHDAIMRAIDGDDCDGGGVVVHCKLGKGRTATVLAAHLLHTGRARSAEEAKRLVLDARPQSMFSPWQDAYLEGLGPADARPSVGLAPDL